MKAKRLLVVVVVVCTAGLLAAGAPLVLDKDQEKIEQGWRTMITRLRSEYLKDRKDIEQLILQDRQRLVEELQQIVRQFAADERRQEIAKTAILMLGKLRAVEAVPLLVEYLVLPPVERPPGTRQLVPPQVAHPSVGALIEIGSPCLQPLLKKVEESDDRGTLILAAVVVNQILGPDLAVAAVKLRLKQPKDDKVRERLLQLQERIDRVERYTKWQIERPKTSPIKP
jgi:hypothetical protein